jgi:high-affinity nickel permease
MFRLMKVTTIRPYVTEGKEAIFIGAVYSLGSQTSQCIVLIKCIIQEYSSYKK